MPLRLMLSDAQWSRIAKFQRKSRKVKSAGRPGQDDRMFVEAVLWILRTGAPWRDLPTEFGSWKTVFNRYSRWTKNGKWHRLLEFLSKDRDNEWHIIDSTINRAHQHSAGGKKGQQRTGSVDRSGEIPPKFTSG